MVSVSRPAPKTRRSLFSLKKAAASQDIPSVDKTAAPAPAIASEAAQAASSSSRPPLVTQGSSSSWIEDSSPPSSPPAKSRQSSERKGQVASTPSPASAAFKFPALRTSRVAGSSHVPAKAALTTGSSPRRPRSRSSPADRALARLDKHSKNRSHFSIPDVMVTAAEEDGEEVYFEVEVPADDRRMKLHTDAVAGELEGQSQGNGYEGAGLDVEQPPRKSLGGKMMPFLRRESSERDEVRGVVITTSQASSGPAARAPKKAISGIFGKKEKNVETAVPVASKPAEETVAQRSNSPYGHPGSAFDSSGSLPLLSSKDSLPSSSTSSHFPRTPPASESTFPEGISGKKVVPVASAVSSVTTADVAASKKQRKANQKEELALIKELARIDKMVREHDAKAKKEAPVSAPVKTPSRMMTIFAARKKGPAPARKVSMVKRSASVAGRERRVSAQHSQSNKGGASVSSTKAPAAPNNGPANRSAAGPSAQPAARSSLDGGERSDDSEDRPSFSGKEWSADLPTTALSSLAGKSGIRYPGLSTDDTLDFTLSSDSELPVGVTLPREDSAVIPLAAVADECNGEEGEEVESISPSSTWSEKLDGQEGENHQPLQQEETISKSSESPPVESGSAASPTPLTRQVSPPEAASTLPPRPPRRQNSAPAGDVPRNDASASRPVPLQSLSMNKMHGPSSSAKANANATAAAVAVQTMSFKPGQIIPDTLPSTSGTRCDSPSLRYASKMANGTGSGGGPEEFTPFRAAMMVAGPSFVADRTGQRM
ncbi:hypothetical protein BCV69DRAFT_281810 [Microstroma glucosiphilum]|uniref:Uncharacterized protein n=1 Tax=Pseudomicrostroma glucosiphilum TaxID=1684307 RepID=A0A316UBX6_9BASI|nr:hypothetical protein BCV69DRAFT_281810 [Pseudomicrostroma glucosiphilum]PWN21903.1 hypothetical protein BCV69DRAFT_281810 [Pseudomicrostroma glucosiphilum]